MEGFGQTETTDMATTFHGWNPNREVAVVPNPQYNVDLIDYEGRSVEAGEQGQMLIRT